MNSQSAKKVSLALGVASVAASVGNVAVKAGPALQTLNNLTNTAEFSVTNTYGQSFSVDGIMTNAAITPFRAGAAGDAANFNATSSTLATNFVGGAFNTFTPVSVVNASASMTGITAPLVLDGTGANGVVSISLSGATTTQTIGASISATLFGPSTIKATTSFTNQLINDLSAF